MDFFLIMRNQNSNQIINNLKNFNECISVDGFQLKQISFFLDNWLTEHLELCDIECIFEFSLIPLSLFEYLCYNNLQLANNLIIPFLFHQQPEKVERMSNS